MAGLVNPPSMTPTPAVPVPSVSDPNIVKQVDAETRKRNGRASTFIMNPQTQREADPTGQRFLGGL